MSPKGRKLLELLKEQDPEMPYPDFKKLFKEKTGYSCCQETWRRYHAQLHPELHATLHQGGLEKKVAKVSEEPSGNGTYNGARDSRYLEDLIRFSCAVEAIGGLSKARQLLGYLESLRSVLTSDPREHQEHPA